MTDPTNGDLADEIERLDSEATPRPWVGPYSDLREDDDTTWEAFSDEDAALIVYLRNNATLIAARLREADALRVEVKALRGRLAAADDACTCSSLDYATAVGCPIHGRKPAADDPTGDAG